MKRSARILLPFGILGLGALGTATLLATAPEVQEQAPERPVPLVRVIEPVPRDVRLSVSTHGTVAPRTESDLVPEVSGPVVRVSPSLVSGGFFEQGDVLLRIDPADYEVERERARAALARAESEYDRAAKELERQRQLSQRDFASVARLDDAENAARVAEAVRREARAALEKAERDLARTTIRAPYDGRVREERVDVGQFVTRGAPIAKLYAIDFAEIRLPVSDEELAFLDLPLWYRGEDDAEGPEVRVQARFAGDRFEWQGRVVRTEGEIDAKSRMVHVIARVEDPYAQREGDDRPPLAVGLFVEAEIGGREVEDVVVLPRCATAASCW